MYNIIWIMIVEIWMILKIGIIGKPIHKPDEGGLDIDLQDQALGESLQEGL